MGREEFCFELYTIAKMISSLHYTGGDAFQQEKRTVFSTEWLPIGVAGQLSATGSYVSATIGGWPVFAVRGADGALRAFRNTCRHKGMMVVEQPAGRCDALRCRYHGWTYGLDGRFREAPTPVAPHNPDSPEHHLAPLGVECWRAIVFVNLEPAAGAGDYGALERFVNTQGGAPGEYAMSIASDIGCNWKAYLEHALADRAAAWHWPLVIVRTDRDATVVEQIMPRTFLRTRAIAHVFVRDAGAREAIMARETARADETRSACEALQAARAGGKAAALDEPRIAALHGRLLEAYSLPAEH